MVAVDSILFSAKSAYGLFRKPYTTTSSLSYSCIHPIAVKGMVGAIMGLRRDELFEATTDMKVGIRVLSPVRRDSQSVKMISMKSDEYRFPVNSEFLRDVKYEICIAWDSKRLDEFESRLKNREYVYSPYFGVSEHLAKLDFIGRYDINLCKSQFVDSIIPAKYVGKLTTNGFNFNMDNIPVKNNGMREYTEYERIVFGFDVIDDPCKIELKEDVDVYDVRNMCMYLF